MRKGLLFVISGPSGSGKGTIVSLLQKKYDFMLSVSATTRAPRNGEMDGVHYHFISHEEFEKNISDGKMLEYTFYSGSGNYYGTPKAPVEKALEEGKDIILEIEVDGASKVKKIMPEAILIFFTAPTMEELKRRLIERGSETEETINKRLQRAKEEINMIDNYDYLIVNEANCPEDAANQILEIARVEKLKAQRNLNIIEDLKK